jgi:outer membrane immunogenic protein
MNNSMRLAVWMMVLLATGNVTAEDFSGGYVGGGLGLNRSSTSGSLSTPAADAPTYGVQGGYGWNVGSTLLGVEGYVDSSQQVSHGSNTQYGSNDYGLGLKIGVPLDSLMPYASIGYDRTQGTGSLSSFSSNAASGGLGLMYKFAPSWSLEGEVSTTSPTMNGLKLRADSLSFGLNYHFDSAAGSTEEKVRSK